MSRYFEYHCYEGEDSGDAELWHHTHQQVEVISKAKYQDGEIGYMYKVRFDDGFENEVFEDELVKSPEEFYRPDYKPTQKGEQCSTKNIAHTNSAR
jgi:hypothetical protein